jgi:hypothetical protein
MHVARVRSKSSHVTTERHAHSGTCRMTPTHNLINVRTQHQGVLPIACKGGVVRNHDTKEKRKWREKSRSLKRALPLAVPVPRRMTHIYRTPRKIQTLADYLGVWRLRRVQGR